MSSALRDYADRWLANFKNAMTGTYHHASGTHLPRYLAEC
jgi:hypothetical protein